MSPDHRAHNSCDFEQEHIKEQANNCTTRFQALTISNMKSFSALALLCFCFLAGSQAAKCVYYGSPTETGEQTANGETFNPMGMTASALSYLPFGTSLQVTNQYTGRSIVVRVNDRFGAPPGEDTLDLTYGAFGMLASHNDGTFPCSYTILS